MTLTSQKTRQTGLILVSLSDISPSPHQPRRMFDSRELEELAQSIRNHGILQPLLVRAAPYGYYLVAGERRWRAAKMIGLSKVPCVIYDGNGDECALATMVENLQRKNLSFWEEAYGFKSLLQTFDFTQEELAERLGKSQASVANKLRLLRLPGSVQSRIAAAGLTERHARALLVLDQVDDMHKVLDKVTELRYTVKQTEDYIQRMQRPKTVSKTTPLVRDRRICKNTIDKAVTLIRKAGISARTEVAETDKYIEYTIRIPKA